MLSVGAASLGAPSPPQQRLGRPAFGHGRVDPRFDAVYQLENSARSLGSVSVRVAASKLSYRDVCDLMAERGVSVVHTAVLRWVQFFVPAFEKMWMKYASPVGSSWRVDETYINHGACAALKNAIDFLYHEWTNKAAGFVAYGGTMGARAVENWRLVMAELQVATVRAQVGLSLFTDFEDFTVFKPAEMREKNVNGMLDQVIAWSGALRSLRDEGGSH